MDTEKKQLAETRIDKIQVETAAILAAHRKRIGKRIVELRNAEGISQNKLGQLAGVSSSNIGKIELAQFNPGLETLCKIGDALGFDVDFVPKKPK